MSNGTSTITKRFALAFSGLVYIFGAPYVVAEGLPFIALWTIVGFGLVRQLILAIAPAGFRYPFPRIAIKPLRDRSLDLSSAVPPMATTEAA